MSEKLKRQGLMGLVRRMVGREPEAPKVVPTEPSPPAPPSTLRVTSHVARDLLQNAAYFNSVPKAVAEYVTNAIDNALPGKPVECRVSLSRDEIRVADNAGGMTYAELSNFFQMHGENTQRRRGRAVRGKFGTGKSAAFGIGNLLRIETVKAGKRNVAEISTGDVHAAKDGQPIPVRELVVNEGVTASHGTTIVIRDLKVRQVDAEAVRTYLTKTLGRHLRRHQVLVDDVACEYHEPEAVKSFRFKPPRETSERIGPASCVLKIAKEPLGRDENVVAVLSNGYLHATTLAGRQGEPLVEYVFGEVEVPNLDVENEPVPAFDNTRSLTLNPQNPRVQALFGWLATCIEKVRDELVERDKRRRYSKEMRLLRRVTAEIEGVLADDFALVQEQLPWATMAGARRRKSKRRKSQSQEPLPPVPQPSLADRGRALFRRLLRQQEDEEEELLPVVRRAGKVQFEINCVRMGKAAPRARYIANRRTIYLNRDHPMLRTAEVEAGIGSLTFKMLLYDVAVTEYALAVVSQLADLGVQVADPVDASEMAQEILERLNRKMAEKLYAEALERSGAPVEAETAPAELKGSGADERSLADADSAKP